jgi:quinol monooxygenase YgiN
VIVTILEAHVAEDGWEELRVRFDELVRRLPPQLIATSLMQDARDRERWRLTTAWKSRDALQQYRDAVDTPEGVLLFRAAGAEPNLDVFEVVAQAENAGAAHAAARADEP